MFGIGPMTDEMLKAWGEGMAERTRRAEAYQKTGMPFGEAYMRAVCDMEHEAWAAAEEAKLKDIRENGT